jgi:peptidoglycan/xylan/chitin deacetylase (PgdA/CDA1 family)
MNTVLGSLKYTARTLLAGAVYTSSLYKWRHRGKVVVLTYHRVLTCGEIRRSYVQPGMYVLDTVFSEHMVFLTKNFTILSLQQLLDLWRNGTWDENARYCTITFDDGWLDNYRHAYPVLKRYGIPATIFLPTDYVGSSEWFWPDQLSFLLHATKDSAAKVEYGKVIGEVLSHYLGKDVRGMGEAALSQESGTDWIIEQCKDLQIERIHELIVTLATELEVPLPQDRVIVNWEEVREMSQSGISFGSHSCSHRILTTITAEDVSQELVRSRRVLLEQKVNYVPAFCYPNGNSNPYIQSQVQASGYEAAVGVQVGIEGRTPRNRFAVRRIGVHNDVSHTIPLFSLRLFGSLPHLSQ